MVDSVAQVVAGEPVDLIEHLARRIADCVLQDPRVHAVTVTVAKPVQRGVIDMDEYVGRFVAVDSVEIRARVSGYLEQVHFRDDSFSFRSAHYLVWRHRGRERTTSERQKRKQRPWLDE